MPNRPFRIPVPVVALADPANADSEISPGDRAEGLIYTPDDEEAALIELVESRFRDSAEARRPHEGEWLESLAFFRGDQWSYWNGDTGRMASLKNPLESDRVYAVANKLKAKGRKIIARAMQSKTTVGVHPLTDLPTDVEASREADAVLSHLDVVTQRNRQMKRLITGCVTTCPMYVKVLFDKRKTVPVPLFAAAANGMNGTGKITEITEQQIGEISETVCSAFEIYPDPKAERVSDGNWLIHAKICPLSQIVTMFPDLGKFVTEEAPDSGPAGRVENLLNNLTGDLNKTSTRSGSALALLKEMWEKPSEAYPNGRYVFVASGVLLWADEYPYDELAREGLFPVAELSYEEGIETPFGTSAITPAVDLQRQRNRAVSKIQEQLKEGTGKILTPRGAEIPVDAFKSGKRNEIISYTVDPEIGGHKPELFPTAPLDPAVIECVKQCDADIDELMGINPPSRGVVPAGVRAEGAILALQDSDLTESVVFQSNLETFREDLARIELAVARQVYHEPRLLSVSEVSAPDESVLAGVDTGDGDDSGGEADGAAASPEKSPRFVPESAPPALSAGYSFKHLGAGRVVLEAKSASPKSPGARVAQIMDMAQAGMFAPAALPTTIALLRLMGIEDTDKLTTDLMAALQIGWKREQAQAAQEAAAKQGAAGATGTPDPAADIQGKIALAQAQGQIKAQGAAQVAQAAQAEKAALADQTHLHRMEEIALQGDVDAAVAKQQKGADATDPTFVAPDPVSSQIDAELNAAIGTPGQRDDASGSSTEPVTARSKPSPTEPVPTIAQTNEES